MYISDLHIHSRFSRATSKEGDPEHSGALGQEKRHSPGGDRRFYPSSVEGRT